MNPEEKAGWQPLPQSHEALERAKAVTDTPQSRAPAYKRAWTDWGVMRQWERRSVRPQV